MNNKHNKLIIIGASGHGKVCADIAVKMGLWKEISFLDDDVSKKIIIDFKVLGTVTDVQRYVKESDVFIAIGNNEIRESVTKNLEILGCNITTLIHPNAVIGIDVEIGIGTVVMAGCIINPSSAIGDGCIINTSVSVDHDNRIGSFVHLSPGVHLAGNVVVHDHTWIGIGSVVKNNTRICSGVTVGAGAVVIEDISKAGTYVGIPARINTSTNE